MSHLPQIISPELCAAVEACCQKHDLLLEPIKVEVLATILGAGMLELVEQGKMEIVGFRRGQLIFKEVE